MKQPLLKRGARGPEVVELQSLIGAVPDGIFGPKTEALLRIVQRARGLDPDGKCGPLTWSKLLDEPDAPEQRGIDLSSYSGLQDFAAHRGAGARFLIVRLTVGTSNDALAKVLLRDAQEAGFELFGRYGYLRGNEPADEQVDALAGRAGEVEAELGIGVRLLPAGEPDPGVADVGSLGVPGRERRLEPLPGRSIRVGPPLPRISGPSDLISIRSGDRGKYRSERGEGGSKRRDQKDRSKGLARIVIIAAIPAGGDRDRKPVFGQTPGGAAVKAPGEDPTMRVRIDNRIRVTGATPEQEAALKALCEHENPRRADLPRLEAMLESRRFDGRLRAQVMAAREEPAVLRTWRLEEGELDPRVVRSAAPELTLPRGVWSTEAWVPFGLNASFEDTRSTHTMGGAGSRWRPKKTLRDYQEAAVTAMLRDEQGLLRQSAGSGKTLALLTFAARCGLPTIAIVPSQALLEQWVAVAIQDFGLTPDDIGCIGGGTKRIRPLTIALVDSLAANDCKLAKELSHTFGCLLFDEVYGAPARTRYDVVDCFAARYRFGAGDDERRKDDVECLTYDLFGEVLAEAPRAMLEKLGWIHSVRVRLVETGTPAPKWWRDLPSLARSTRYLEIVRHLEDDPKRAALVAALACLAVRSGNQVLVFGHHRDHALRMQADVVSMAPDLAHATGRFLGGTIAAKERQDTSVGLLEGRTKAAFATYKALGKGINLPAVSRAVLATPIHGARENVNQVLARINRTADGKDRPEAAVLYDSEVFGLSPVRKFMAGKRDVVVQTADGRELPARDYIEEWEAKESAEKETPGSFFESLGGSR